MLDELLADAATQLNRYAQCEKVSRTKGNTELLKLAVVFRGWDLERFVRVR
ncbi:MAG: hypothetical protein RR365_08100 [Bacteroides sp.]